jgi:hypothetical protein
VLCRSALVADVPFLPMRIIFSYQRLRFFILSYQALTERIKIIFIYFGVRVFYLHTHSAYQRIFIDLLFTARACYLL